LPVPCSLHPAFNLYPPSQTRGQRHATVPKLPRNPRVAFHGHGLPTAFLFLIFLFFCVFHSFFENAQAVMNTAG
jgi:hypothetical protein